MVTPMMGNSFKNLLKGVSLIAICAVMASCATMPDLGKLASISPYNFDFTPNRSDVRVAGYILSELDSVEVRPGNTLQMFGGGKAILGTYKTTQITGEFTTTPVRGNGIRFILRSNADTLNHPTALRFEYTPTGSTVFNGNTVLLKNDTVRAIPGRTEMIRITNDGHLCRIVVGCETIFTQKIESALTEYITVEALPDSEVILSDIEFFRLFPERNIVSSEISEEEAEWSLLKTILRLIGL